MRGCAAAAGADAAPASRQRACACTGCHRHRAIPCTARRPGRGQAGRKLPARAAGVPARRRNCSGDPRPSRGDCRGETGSGKTTQLPKMCLARVAANAGDRARNRGGSRRERGERVAYELATSSATRSATRSASAIASTDASIKLMTDGILLAEIQGDRCSLPTTPSSSTRRTSAASTSTSCWAT